MITKYDMTSGELTHQIRQKGKAVVAPKPHELVDLIASLQLVEIKVQPESKTMPTDLISISIADFLRSQY